MYGVVLLGSQKDVAMDENYRTVLQLYADLASTLFESQSLVVTPVKATRETLLPTQDPSVDSTIERFLP
jgi:hypothetical protein